MYLPTFDTITSIKFPVSWPLGSGEEVRNRFSKWPSWQTSLISDLNDLSYLCSTKSPRLLSSFELFGLSVQEMKFKTDFQKAAMAAILGFQSEWVSQPFYLQVFSILITEFQVNWTL